ncbi:hypothetical protein ATE47_04135 [Chryseobacterium sp. IHB B 17019]|uniref:GIY-YIG nuclease family protein n=1 Tax=Chryseobacterium sp. IHB B 17019 TaxID=1721091 RepID=UPI00071F34A4|nr:GIY-YIG nuclease family protein [Chryseobacterium sp. IHB B 17019]ALR29758.1 hypothetical protein ATE47_04135 [Chryseobacterium sp. IHB B 17019]
MENGLKYKSLQHSKKMADNATLVNKSKKPDGYIYVLQYGRNNIFKFGVSSSPDRRIKDIDACSPIPVKEIGRFYFKNVYEMEEMIHDNLKGGLIRREWFKLNELSAKAICEQLQEMSNNGIFLIKKDGST